MEGRQTVVRNAQGGLVRRRLKRTSGQRWILGVGSSTSAFASRQNASKSAGTSGGASSAGEAPAAAAPAAIPPGTRSALPLSASTIEAMARRNPGAANELVKTRGSPGTNGAVPVAAGPSPATVQLQPSVRPAADGGTFSARNVQTTSSPTA